MTGKAFEFFINFGNQIKPKYEKPTFCLILLVTPGMGLKI